MENADLLEHQVNTVKEKKQKVNVHVVLKVLTLYIIFIPQM